MSSITVSRLGVTQAESPQNWEDENKLFLKKYAGEVLTAFAETNVALDRTDMREIESGKSAQFPVMGRAGAWYYKPGEQIQGGTIKHDEKIITIDDLLISDQYIYQLDEAKNHYEVRSKYSVEQGRALSRAADKHILQVGVKAARQEEGNITGELGTPGGTVIKRGTGKVSTDADLRYNGDDLADALFTAAQRMDEKEVPEEDRVAYFRPAQYYALIDSKKAINRDWNAEGANGSFAGGNIWEVAGIEIVKTNHLPSSNVTESPYHGDDQEKYSGDFSNTVGLVMHNSAVGTVKLLDLSLESEYLIQYQGQLMVAKYSMGHGILRPESAVEIRDEDEAA